MSSPLAGSRPIFLNPQERSPSPAHRQNDSLSSAEDFFEIENEPTTPRSDRTPEILNVSPATSSASNTPTPTALPPSFADRHPVVTNALTTCATNMTWFAVTASALPLYMLTSPIRIFATVLSLISPKQGASFTKSPVFEILTGSMGKEISHLATNKNREELAVAGVLDILSLGISFSAASAFEIGQSAAKKTRSSVSDVLSNGKQRRLAEAAQARQRLDERENNGTAEAIAGVQPLSVLITRLQANNPNINVHYWEILETNNNINTKALSALLKKLQTGALLNNQEEVLIKRITDVLIKCQESPDLTKQVCEIALERGLASCTDRAATAWIAIEEYIDTTHIANQITQLTQNPEMPGSQNTNKTPM